MYPAARRARGLSFVLVGAAIGAIVAPLVFAPLLGGGRADLLELALPWLVGSGIMIAGLVLTYAMRRDPLDFPAEGSDVVQRACVGDAGPSVEEFPRTEASAHEAARPVRVLVGLPGVSGALVAAVIAQVVMSSTMTVIGVALRDHGHDLSGVSFTISVHFLGMFGLVLVVGYLIDRIGRRRSMTGGLFILAAGVAALAAGTTFGTVLPAMFAVGVGWNVAFVAATALMADATQPHERARLLGFGDLLAAGTAAAGTIGAGAILNWAGCPRSPRSGAQWRPRRSSYRSVVGARRSRPRPPGCSRDAFSAGAARRERRG
jgi:hypothetical protein